MRKGLIIVVGVALTVCAASGPLAAQVYKIVDENGNVTYTDQPPPDGTPPMELPEISVVDTSDTQDYVSPIQNDADEAGMEARTPRELREMFRDFRILAPAPDETYWGTGNTVVVSWGSDTPYEPGMTVSVVVDGQTHERDPNANLPLTLDRGQHQVFAVLRDQNGRRVVTSDTVTFQVQQGSRLVNPG